MQALAAGGLAFFATWSKFKKKIRSLFSAKRTEKTESDKQAQKEN
jgi:hypothetical protein